MNATVPFIEQKFEEFSRQMFGGKLPKIPVELSDAKTFLGQYGIYQSILLILVDNNQAVGFDALL